MRVLQVLPALDHGGAENVAEALATGANPDLFDMMVCCTRGLGPVAERIRAAGIPVTLTGPHERPNPYVSVWHLHKILERLKPDVVHSHGITSLCDIGTLSLLSRVPAWVHTFHYGNYPYPNRKHMIIEGLMSRLPDQLVTVADAQRAALLTLHKPRPDRIMTIVNGVRTNRFIDDPGHRRRKRAELGLADDAFVVGAVAVLSEQKGITYLVRAARLVAEQCPRVRFLIVGGGPLEQKLREEAAALGVSANVHFTGWRNDVADIFPALDVWVMSSLWEAMPLALLEGMASRLPIVVTEVGDNRQVVGNGSAGVLVPPGSAEAIAAAVLRLGREESTKAALADAAYRRFQTEYSISRMVAAYEAVYEAQATAQARVGR